jgi:hypothetical protein
MRESRPGIAGSVVHFHQRLLILLITITEVVGYLRLAY